MRNNTILWLFACLTFTLLLLTACTPDDKTVADPHPMRCEKISDFHKPKDMQNVEGKELKILQWEHFVPRYDDWFSKCAQKWAEETGVKVTITRIDLAKLDSHTSAEILADEGHDLIEWLSPPAQFEPDVLDLTDVYDDVTEKFGDPVELCHKSTYNPHTEKRYGFAHGWALSPGNYRRDLWKDIEMPDGPSTYDELLKGGEKIKEQLGFQMGIGMADEIDSNMAIRAVLWSFGGSVQDDKDGDGKIEVTINTDETEDAVRYLVDLYENAATSEVFWWNAASNNQGLVAGELSYIVNSPSAYRSAQKINPGIAEKIGFTRPLKGPTDEAVVSAHVVFTYMIPKYSEVPDVAKAFLRYLVDNYNQAVHESELYNFPCWEESAPKLDSWLDDDPFGSEPSDKLSIFKDIKDVSVNNGHPGYANPAIGEVFDRHILPQMVRKAASGEMTPEEAVEWAESQIVPIFEKWHERGLIEIEKSP